MNNGTITASGNALANGSASWSGGGASGGDGGDGGDVGNGGTGITGPAEAGTDGYVLEIVAVPFLN